MALPPDALARAWVFTDAGTPLSLSTVPLTGWPLARDEVLVELTCAAVCGSDVHTARGARVDPAAPLVLGHEGIGVVVASARAGVAAGAAVTWALAAPQCEPEGSCAPCALAALPQKCARVLKYGHAPWRSALGAAHGGGGGGGGGDGDDMETSIT